MGIFILIVFMRFVGQAVDGFLGTFSLLQLYSTWDQCPGILLPGDEISQRLFFFIADHPGVATECILGTGSSCSDFPIEL